MSAALVASVLLVLFAGASLLTDTLSGRARLLPIGMLSLLVFLVWMELARYDHGHTDVLFTIGYIGAPLVAIFGGASWGTRRFYGWPDLGPHPSRAGLVSLCLMLGVLVGVQVQARDIRASQQLAESLRQSIATYRAQSDGAYPERLTDAVADPPRTKLGWLGPPAYEYGRDRDGRPVLAFPIGAEAYLVLDLEADGWHRRRGPPMAMDAVGPKPEGAP